MNYNIIKNNVLKTFFLIVLFFPLFVFLGELGYKNYRHVFLVRIDTPIINGMYATGWNVNEINLLDLNNPDIQVVSLSFPEKIMKKKLYISNDTKKYLKIGQLPKFDFIVNSWSGMYYQNYEFLDKKETLFMYKEYMISTSQNITKDEIKKFFQPLLINENKNFLLAKKKYKQCLSIYFYQENFNLIKQNLIIKKDFNPYNCIFYTKRYWLNKSAKIYKYPICYEPDFNNVILEHNKNSTCSQTPKINLIKKLHGNINYYVRIIYYLLTSGLVAFFVNFFLINRLQNEK